MRTERPETILKPRHGQKMRLVQTSLPMLTSGSSRAHGVDNKSIRSFLRQVFSNLETNREVRACGLLQDLSFDVEFSNVKIPLTTIAKRRFGILESAPVPPPISTTECGWK